MASLESIFRVANTIKTPLMLSAMALIILWSVYQKVLSLDIFANIGSDATYHLLNTVITYLFVLALVLGLLGIASYLVTLILRRRLPIISSNVDLIDASLDPRDSPYEETR